MFHNLHSAYGVNLNDISKCKIVHKIFLKRVVKTCENDFSNAIFIVKVKVRDIKSHIYNKTQGRKPTSQSRDKTLKQV